MTDKQIIINDYFNIMRDKNGRIFCIQKIGDLKSLIKAIREQNEYIQDKEQECEELKKQLMLKNEVDMFFNTPIEGWSNDPCGICRYKQILSEIKEIAEENIRIADLEGLNGVYRRGLAEQILQKISECEVN